MMSKAEKLGKKLILPVDAAVADAFPNPIDAEIPVDYVDVENIPADKIGLDIGPKSAELFAEAAKTAKTVVWLSLIHILEEAFLYRCAYANVILKQPIHRYMVQMILRLCSCLLYTSRCV